LADFWRRWHMSMSFFLRDYLYIPLGGSRVSRSRHYLNYLIVMLVCGMWHGSAGHFVVWGVIQGLGLMATHAVLKTLRRRPPGSTRAAWLRRWAGTAVTFHFVTASWVFFFFDVDLGLFILYRIGGGGP
jgi:D-alanyl-lipoteichoic acid acyltransferase DltB (MBOAT superfamily)